jgi:hypothetical protein
MGVGKEPEAHLIMDTVAQAQKIRGLGGLCSSLGLGGIMKSIFVRNQRNLHGMVGWACRGLDF